MNKRTQKEIVLKHFENKAPAIAQVLTKIDFDDWFGKEILDSNFIFKSLCRTIAGQQLAGKAADAIYGRFEKLFEDDIIPEKVMAIEPESIRGIGFSWAKVRSVQDLSSRVINKELVLENLENLDDESLIIELSKVKGIGRWTAEMFLMFRLGREDVFSWGDLGLKNGLKKYLGNAETTLEEMGAEVEKWKPFRTYGAMAMWHLLDNR
jgi:DNA-3-methyladenine glycosylase II